MKSNRIYVTYNHHGHEMVVDSELKGKHRDLCLCHHPCSKFKPNSDGNCPKAQAVYENCVLYGLVTPVVECEDFEPDNAISLQMIDFWNNYQEESRKTAQYPDIGKNPYYVTLGLCGEIGELFSNSLENVLSCNQKESIKKEFGDIFWYISQLAYEFNYKMGDLFEPSLIISSNDKIKHVITTTCVLANVVKKIMRDDNGDITNKKDTCINILSDIFSNLLSIVKNADLSYQDIANDNKAKLASRLERNVIKGDGDNR